MIVEDNSQIPSDASAVTVARWLSLRDAVVSELRAVGLPAFASCNGRTDSDGRVVGILVDVSTLADEGGVQIDWHQPDERLTPITQALEAGTAREVVESMMVRYGGVGQVLTNAAVLVLGIAGFTLEPSRRTYSALEYDVLHGPGEIELDDRHQ
ncbi:hypothetical protein [Micromonospora sp. NPDC048839]|uniref:hypothetical protein n=1 Tax=Micromonospora sp. NPDC048839 TaxID=3155641 RepID=UPI0033C4FB23